MRKPDRKMDFGCPKADAFPYIPAGTYEVIYVGYDGPVAAFGPDESRLYLHWEVVSQGKYMGARLFQSFKHYSKWGPQSKYYRCWNLAAGYRPRSRTRMTLEVFKGKVFLAWVDTVKPVFENGPFKGRHRPESEWYSIVRDLLEVAAGSSQKQETSRE